MSGSPGRSINRTFHIVFKLPKPKGKLKIFTYKWGKCVKSVGKYLLRFKVFENKCPSLFIFPIIIPVKMPEYYITIFDW